MPLEILIVQYQYNLRKIYLIDILNVRFKNTTMTPTQNHKALETEMKKKPRKGIIKQDRHTNTHTTHTLTHTHSHLKLLSNSDLGSV